MNKYSNRRRHRRQGINSAPQKDLIMLAPRPAPARNAAPALSSEAPREVRDAHPDRSSPATRTRGGWWSPAPKAGSDTAILTENASNGSKTTV